MNTTNSSESSYSLNKSKISTTSSFNMLLDSLGFNQSLSILTSFVLPFINLISILLCSLSVYIFFHSRFMNQIYFYFRLLCLVYIIHSMHNIPFGPLFPPRFIPWISTYSSSIYIIYYGVVTNFLYHFEDLIQMAILLDRIKVFSPFLISHLTGLSLRSVSFSIFLACFCVNFWLAFAFKITPFGTYHYISKPSSNNSSIQEIGTFYFVETSDFSSTLFGRLLLAFTQPFVGQFLTLILGIILNIVSVYKFKSYFDQREPRDKNQGRADKPSERETINSQIEK